MTKFLCFAILAALILCCLAQDCPECRREECKNPGPCVHGQTLDFCNCCETCYRGLGEQCGGPLNTFGVCTHHLSCIRLPGMKEEKEFEGAGKCLALPR